jgi:hypothetical protein
LTGIYREGKIVEGKVIYDKTFGHVTYGCAHCCGIQSVYPLYDPLGVPFQLTNGNGVLGDDNCGNTGLHESPLFYGNWSTANTSIATVDYYATHRGVGAGATTSFTHGQISAAGRASCPLQTRNTQGQTNVQVPTFFLGTTADPLISPNCGPNEIGGGAAVHYQVADQFGLPMAVSGMTPQEHFTVNGSGNPGFSAFATPPTTDASGMFTDTPVGTCFNNKPPLTTNPCVDVVQTFNIVKSGITYPVSTTTTRRDCAKGIRIQVSNPAPGTSNIFSNGTVN